MATTASSRLRKAFRYPSEDDADSDNPDDLDEEHQEQLIFSLAAEDARKNELYRNAFLCIPLLAAVYFLIVFVTQQQLLALLSATSLVCTAYILKYMPVEKNERRPRFSQAAKGPLEKYLLWLNAALAGILQLAAVVSWTKGNAEQALRDSLGLLIFLLMAWVRIQLRPMNLEELVRARYELKGA